MKFSYSLAIVLFSALISTDANADFEAELEISLSGNLVSEDAFITCLTDATCDEQMSQVSGYEEAQAACAYSNDCALRMLLAMSRYLDTMLSDMPTLLEASLVVDQANVRLREESAAEKELIDAMETLVSDRVMGHPDLHAAALKRAEDALSALKKLRAREWLKLPDSTLKKLRQSRLRPKLSELSE